MSKDQAASPTLSQPCAERHPRLRFDVGTPGNPGRLAASADVISLFRAWDGADGSHEERRRSPRYSPAESRVWVGWWNRSHFVIGRATLVNLSQGGALILSSRQPPSAQPVWVCIGSPHPADSIQGRVLETRATLAPEEKSQPEGNTLTEGNLAPGLVYVVRMEFHEPCPPAFFQAAGEKPSLDLEAKRDEPAEQP